MGLIFFNHPAKSELYMEDKTLFKKDVREIEDSDTTLTLVQLFSSEKAIDRRYLKVIYHLNNKLPYRIETFYAENIDALLKKGFDDISFYKLILRDFLEGYIHIWLEETDPANFNKLQGHVNYRDFLKFVYAVDQNYPFVINTLVIKTPTELILHSQQDKGFRQLLYKSLSAGNPQVWFAETGRNDWNTSYQPLAAYVADLDGYIDEDKLALTIQALQQVVEPSLPLPFLLVSENAIDFINIEGTRQAMKVFSITAQNNGYLRAVIELKNTSGDKSLPVGSITLDTSVIDFDSFEGKTSASVIVALNPLEFIKDQLYTFEISITTLYQTLVLPVNVRVVFPQKQYLIYLAKYAAFGIAFFLLVRALGKLITDRQDYFPYMPSFISIYNNFEDFYWKYLIVMIIALCGILISYRIAKQVEKL